MLAHARDPRPTPAPPALLTSHQVGSYATGAALRVRWRFAVGCAACVSARAGGAAASGNPTRLSILTPRTRAMAAIVHTLGCLPSPLQIRWTVLTGKPACLASA